jgi:hypothetical protein
MKSMLVLTQYPITDRDWHRFGLYYFEKHGYEIIPWDLEKINSPSFEEIKTADVVYDTTGQHFKFDIDKEFIFKNNTGIKIQCKNTDIPLKTVYKQITTQKIRNKIYNIFNKNKFKYDGIVTAGQANLQPNSIDTHAQDYDQYLKMVRDGKNRKVNNTIVFIDSAIGTHPDQKNEQVTGIDKSKYETQVNKLLEILESVYGYDIEIAAHPRNTHEPFSSWNMKQGQTCDQVRKCLGIIHHYSTVRNFAVLWNKPMFFITSDDLNKTKIGPHTRYTAGLFGERVFNIDHLETLKNRFLSLHKEHVELYYRCAYNNYNWYLENYIKSPTSPDKYSWEILHDEIKMLEILRR